MAASLFAGACVCECVWEAGFSSKLLRLAGLYPKSPSRYTVFAPSRHKCVCTSKMGRGRPASASASERDIAGAAAAAAAAGVRVPGELPKDWSRRPERGGEERRKGVKGARVTGEGEEDERMGKAR